MNRSYQFFCALILSAFCAIQARATTRTAASVSQVDVYAQIALSVSGDTVLIPAGTNTWNTFTPLTNGIYIIGAGTNSTRIRNNQALSGGFQLPLFAVSMKEDKLLTVANIYFESVGGNNNCAIEDNENNGIFPTKVRVTSCIFDHFNFALMLRADWGVIDHCYFSNNVVVSRCAGIYTTNDLYQIPLPPWDWDSTNTLCFELNTMVVDSTVQDQYFGDTELSAAYTIRSNIFNITRAIGHEFDGYDMHGNGNFPAGINYVGVQIYNNIINQSGGVSPILMGIRGGWGSLVYSNKVNGFTSSVNVVGNNPAGSILPTNTFVFDNADSGGAMVVNNGGGGVTLNRDYFLSKPAGFKQLAFPHYLDVPLPSDPSITVQPNNQTVTTPATATFSVTATGTATLTYQWYKNGVSIGGATSASYTTPATTTGDNGSLFHCIVSGPGPNSPVTSSDATLGVNGGFITGGGSATKTYGRGTHGAGTH